MTRIGFGLMLAGLATSALLALGASRAAASPVAMQKATSTCWKDVVNDWLRNQPNVVGTYAIPCYTQAIQHLNKYPDIQQYSNAPDDIHRALLAAMRDNHNGPGSTGGSSSGQSSAPASSGGSSSGGSSSGSSGGKTPSSTSSNVKGTGDVAPVSKSLVTKLFDSVGPGNAESIPLPLLVLAGLALLLLLAAVATWLAKRIQARRMAPAPAPAERR